MWNVAMPFTNCLLRPDIVPWDGYTWFENVLAVSAAFQCYASVQFKRKTEIIYK